MTIPAFGFTFWLQTLFVAALGGYVMRERSLAEFAWACIIAVWAVKWVVARGVPLWTQDYGDAYDLGVLIFMAICLLRGGQ